MVAVSLKFSHLRNHFFFSAFADSKPFLIIYSLFWHDRLSTPYMIKPYFSLQSIRKSLRRNLVCVMHKNFQSSQKNGSIFYFGYIVYFHAGIEPWTFVQKLGEAVLIPAGCPHQVRNIKVNEKFRHFTPFLVKYLHNKSCIFIVW